MDLAGQNQGVSQGVLPREALGRTFACWTFMKQDFGQAEVLTLLWTDCH